MTRDELLRLIDQAAQEGWEGIDLSDKDFIEFPSEIPKLINLTS